MRSVHSGPARGPFADEFRRQSDWWAGRGPIPAQKSKVAFLRRGGSGNGGGRDLFWCMEKTAPTAEEMWRKVMPSSLNHTKYAGVAASQKFSSGASNKLSALTKKGRGGGSRS